MKLIGLTGSIGMGKSTIAGMFADLGAAVWNADDAVHRLYGRNGDAVLPVAQAFPDAVADGIVDRSRLSRVLNNADDIKKLEAIVHPLVAKDRMAAIDSARAAGKAVMVLDIPLLFETGAAGFFDGIVVVSAPAYVQRARVLERDGMSQQKFEQILAKQTPDEEKRSQADYVIDTNLDIGQSRLLVEQCWVRINEGDTPSGQVQSQFTSDHRLAVYGALATEKPSAYGLANIEGSWVPGIINGHVTGTGAETGADTDLNSPAIKLDDGGEKDGGKKGGGEKIEVRVFEAADLPGHWSRLDVVFGTENNAAYARQRTLAQTEDGLVAVSVYAAHKR